MRIKELLYLFILAALWGASFLFIRIAAPALGPFITIELRVFIAGMILIIYAWISGKKVDVLQRWKEYLFLGAVNAGIPFTLIAIASLNLPSSIASILCQSVSKWVQRLWFFLPYLYHFQISM